MKNVLVGSPAVLITDKIHCNKYSGTRRVMSVRYPGSKISTRLNLSPVKHVLFSRVTGVVRFVGILDENITAPDTYVGIKTDDHSK